MTATITTRRVWRCLSFSMYGKRTRTKIHDHISTSFFSQIHSVPSNINEIIDKVLARYKDINMEPLKIKSFTTGVSFSEAVIDMTRLTNYEPIQFQSIFKTGFDAFAGQGELNPDLEFAVQCLKTGFLQDKDFHEKCLQRIMTIPNYVSSTQEETYVACILANHLLSRLTAKISGMQTYFVSNDHSNSDLLQCPCKLCDGDYIPHVNAGIGSEHLWYGRPDIVIFSNKNDASYFVTPQIKPDDSPEERSKQIMEIKKENNLREQMYMNQFIAQSLTFSFYQLFRQRQKYYRKTLSLIPTVAFCGDLFDIYIYDCEDDILLRNQHPINLFIDKCAENECDIDNEDFAHGAINLSAVLQLWMVVNHLSIFPSLSSEDSRFLKGTGDFLPYIPEKRMRKILRTLEMKKRFYPSHGSELRKESSKLINLN